MTRALRATTVLLLASLPLAAQEQPDWRSRVSVHGYLHQAYAVSDDRPIFGIPTDGTTDYRDLALQLRYDHDRDNALVVQLRHQRRGAEETPAETVDLDWAFYQRNISERFSLKAGRIPLPLGIFNEAGGVGTTSPFFEPPYEFYDRAYTSRTLDGVLGSVALGNAGDWTFDLDAYGGVWRLEEWGDGAGADARDAWGAQLWANSPWPGIRFGAGAYRCTVEPPADAPEDYLMLHASADADLDRWRFAAEFLSGNLASYGTYRSWYAQAGFQVTPRFSVHARGAIANVETPYYGHDVSARLSEDLGLVLNYAITPGLAFKLEGHTNEGFLTHERPLDLYDSPSKTRYLIASIAATF